MIAGNERTDAALAKNGEKLVSRRRLFFPGNTMGRGKRKRPLRIEIWSPVFLAYSPRHKFAPFSALVRYCAVASLRPVNLAGCFCIIHPYPYAFVEGGVSVVAAKSIAPLP